MLFVAFRMRLRARTQLWETNGSSDTRSRVLGRPNFVEKISEKLFSAFEGWEEMIILL